MTIKQSAMLIIALSWFAVVGTLIFGAPSLVQSGTLIVLAANVTISQCVIISRDRQWQSVVAVMIAALRVRFVEVH